MDDSQGQEVAGPLPSSCRLTGSAGSLRRPLVWRGWSSQPAVSGKAWPPTGATTSRRLWETWRSREWAPHRPTGETGAELINIVTKGEQKKNQNHGKQGRPVIACGFFPPCVWSRGHSLISRPLIASFLELCFCLSAAAEVFLLNSVHLQEIMCLALCLQPSALTLRLRILWLSTWYDGLWLVPFVTSQKAECFSRQ